MKEGAIGRQTLALGEVGARVTRKRGKRQAQRRTKQDQQRESGHDAIAIPMQEDGEGGGGRVGRKMRLSLLTAQWIILIHFA